VPAITREEVFFFFLNNSNREVDFSWEALYFSNSLEK